LCQANEEAPSWYQKSRRLVMVVWVQQWPLHTHTEAGIYGLSQSQLITSALKMEKAHFSKMLASCNQSTWQFNPKEHHRNIWACLHYRDKTPDYLLIKSN
jgi:hypothetical protein